MLSESSARESFAASAISSTVACGDTIVPMAAPPCLATTSFNPSATRSSATCQSTLRHWPFSRTIGVASRSSLASAS